MDPTKKSEIRDSTRQAQAGEAAGEGRRSSDELRRSADAGGTSGSEVEVIASWESFLRSWQALDAGRGRKQQAATHEHQQIQGA